MATHRMRGRKKLKRTALTRKNPQQMKHKTGKNKDKQGKGGNNASEPAKEPPAKPAKVVKLALMAKAEEAEGSAAAPQKVLTNAASKKAARLAASLERQIRTMYPGDERVLLVGEGNFSFARALCIHLGSGAGLYATSYDDDSTLKAKYTDAPAIRKEIEDKYGATVLTGIDATRLHEVREFRAAFSKIIWNFPHIGGGEKDLEKSAAEHRALLAKFFKSAIRCLAPEANSAIHVALKAGEPYKSWKLVQTARNACEELELKTSVPFVSCIWQGYSHRRTAGFDERFSKADSEELAKGAKTYVFRRTKAS
eukprot:gnl/TRDRNA2_/TRDRNA2_60233_c0_seq1.p1 gnl/TRDRNA2_/TRDRNA2_60233_c0~~gnl/TRDRNA2_/TRDRNA2_60233_c0_seq1.p1  ORF type:complete len:310 (+),score=75.02 gnl/TRDRNA2_/TRDRNA2_60233_c0_seq1:79-1008(+)